jgi:hypothetical protein
LQNPHRDVALGDAASVAGLRQLFGEPAPEQLSLLASCLPSGHREVSARDVDPSASIGTQVERPGGIVVATEIEGADRI